MVFNSYIFILLFLPVTLIGYYGLMRLKKGDAARLFLTAVSLVFYAYFRPVHLPVLIGSICVNYFFASFIDKREKNKKAFLITGIVFNILLLFVFKYLDFTIGTINAVSGSSIPAQYCPSARYKLFHVPADSISCRCLRRGYPKLFLRKMHSLCQLFPEACFRTDRGIFRSYTAVFG